MGNVSATQLTHFIMLMVYMSFCRLKHYTEHMEERNTVMLKTTLWMSLVIVSFRTTFLRKGGHSTINSYFKDLLSEVRRNLHVAVTRFMEQECGCQNHVQCKLYPTTLISEVVLPSYQHFLQHIHQTGTTKKVSNESDALHQYDKTITMLILARVNGYYSPYLPQTIMEEEAKTLYGDVFTLAKRDFFKHRLLTLFPHVTEKSIETSLTFLEQQKLANCPCFVHTEQRGFDWVVFRRQPDKITCDCEDIPEMEDDPTDGEDFFSVKTDEAIVTPLLGDDITISPDDPQYNTCNVDKIQDPSGAASSVGEKPSSAEFLNGSKTSHDPQESILPCDLSLHSRDTNIIKTQKQKNEQKEMDDGKEVPMNSDETKGDGVMYRKSSGYYYNPFLYYKRNLDKTYYYQYFKPYSHDHRMLMCDDECHCPRGKIHDSNCSWYNPDIIYILDTKGDLSISEQDAQRKIYQMYQNTLSNPPESCGCGTAAAIAYMGHSTGCIEFLHMHERKSFEVLLAILKKRKKMTFSRCSNNQSKRPRLHSPKLNEEAKNDTEEVPEVQKVPTAKEVQPNLSQEPTGSLSVLADVDLPTLDTTQTNTQLNDPPKYLPDLVTVSVDGADCPCEEADEEIPPLEDAYLVETNL